MLCAAIPLSGTRERKCSIKKKTMNRRCHHRTIQRGCLVDGATILVNLVSLSTFVFTTNEVSRVLDGAGGPQAGGVEREHRGLVEMRARGAGLLAWQNEQKEILQ